MSRTEALVQTQSHTPTKTTCCNTPGCITLYKGKQCLFCETAKTILADALTLYGFSTELIHEVELDNGEDKMSEIVGLPTIRICNEIITGVPDAHIVGTAIIRAFIQGCLET